ncbi:MAG: hypothetical protein EOP04_06040 [Proteobacteria bacterium]|nr:MAG: hypothetical protein EOP04_06040 [Pseudomonadota bacterium]
MNIANQSIDSLRRIKASIKSILPRQFHISDPISQIFVNQADLSTSITLTNFPSFFAPMTPETYIFDVSIRGNDGITAWHESFLLNAFESMELNLTWDVTKTILPQLGIVSVSMRPKSHLYYGDKGLGRLTPHFFVKYGSKSSGSIAIIHPQTALNAAHTPGLSWKSNSFIDLNSLESLSLIQINPTSSVVDTTVYLCDAKTGQRLAEDRSLRQPYTSYQMNWKTKDLKSGLFAFVGVDGLPSNNAKPLIFGIYPDQTFYAYHG